MNLKGSHTERNLKKALQGEALAHLKYQFYRSQLSNTSKEIEKELDEIIHNEKEHGKIWFKLLHDKSLPSDIDNLDDAISGEKHEAYKMYPEFSRVAREEGFEEIAILFEEVAKIEKQHSIKFTEIFKNIEENNMFMDDKKQAWKCLNCGHISYGDKAPEECPVCNHPQKYFIRD